MVKILFVCMGNICRSPTAHGVFESLVNRQGLARHIEIDSAGTHAYHVGEAPDQRASQAASSRGFDLSYIRARRVELSDFEYFDYILAMDKDNYAVLTSLAPSSQRGKVRMFLEFASDSGEAEVPDPYYGGAHGFEYVLDLVEEASEGLLKLIKREHL